MRAQYKYTHQLEHTQAWREEAAPTPQCFQLSHQVSQLFTMEGKMGPCVPFSGGSLWELSRLPVGERKKTLASAGWLCGNTVSLAVHFQVPAGLSFETMSLLKDSPFLCLTHTLIFELADIRPHLDLYSWSVNFSLSAMQRCSHASSGP